jgi:putative redox protein
MTDNIRPRPLFAKDIVGSISATRQQVDLEWRAGTFLIDEPRFNGGQDLGPDPFTLVLSGLAGCTLTTLRMYIRRKEWPIHDITVSVNIMQQLEPFLTTIHRQIVLRDAATDEQRDKLLYIAKNCPVARLLEGALVIDTRLSLNNV